MTVYRAKDRAGRGADGQKAKAFRYDFQYLGRRHVSPRSFPTEREAKDAEAERRRQLRRAAAGLETGEAKPSPRIADWAEVYLDFLKRRQRVTDLHSIEDKLRVVMRFWGRKPAGDLAAHQRGPYHDLCLDDPIKDSRHLLAFEEWMLKRGVKGTTRNHYRSAMSRLYAVALLPEYRSVTHVTMNPFLGLLRDPRVRRTAVMTLPQIRAVMSHAAPHLRLAIAIGTLAPSLRLDNVLGLEWTDLSDDYAWLKVTKHKNFHRTGLPLVTPVSNQLRDILRAAFAQRDETVPWVVSYHRKRLVKLDSSLKSALKAAGLIYGRDNGGITFHTLRHSMATWMAEAGVPEKMRQLASGHASISSTQIYTHLAPVHVRPTIERISEALPLRDLLIPAQTGADLPDPPDAPSPGKDRSD